MAKIAMIGAGSLVFCKTLMSDFLATPALAGSEYRLMALSHTRLDKMEAFVKRMIKDNGVKASVVATTDRRAALKDATELMSIRQLTRRDHPEYRGEDTESDSMQMITQTEVTDPGAQWVHRFSLYGNEGVSPLAQSCMADLLEEFAAIGGWLAASGARGFGSVSVAPYAARALPALTSSAVYLDHVETHKAELVALLGECAKGAGDAEPKSKAKPASKGVKAAVKAAQQELDAQEPG